MYVSLHLDCNLEVNTKMSIDYLRQTMMQLQKNLY